MDTILDSIDESSPGISNRNSHKYGTCRHCGHGLEICKTQDGCDSNKQEKTYKKKCGGCNVIWYTNYLKKTI